MWKSNVKVIITYEKFQDQNQRDITTNSLLILINLFSLRGFVKISSSWSLMPTNSSIMSPFCAWSLWKWCLISLCLVLECCTRFFEMLMTLILLHLIGTCSNDKPKSLKVCFIQRFCAQHKPIAIYSTSIVDKSTKFCFLLCHETNEWTKKWHVSLVLFLSTLQPVKSAYGKPINLKLSLLGYYKPKSIVPFMYLRILFMTLKYDSLVQDWKSYT